MERQMRLMDILETRIEGTISEMERSGVYMPCIATVLRLKADEIADRYPDDTNGGVRHSDD